MKKIFAVLLCVLILAMNLYAGSAGVTGEVANLQKIYSTTSQEYEAIKYVYLC